MTKPTNRKRALRAIMPADPELTGPLVLNPMASVPELGKKIEQAGKGYAALQTKRMFPPTQEEEKKQSDEGSDDVAEDGKNFESKKKKRTKEEIDAAMREQEDLYALLDISEKSIIASEKDVTKAYRKMALIYHPDKLGDKLTEEKKAIWLKIQKAYDTLTDPKKKKEYDSTLPFDDKFPKQEDIENEKEFYDVWGKCFARNAKFSQVQPVPCFGFGSTDMKDVNKFYKFWHDFKTWRTFNQYDEYSADDIEHAEDRYERRWLENANKKCRKKYDKEEQKRLVKLVESAYDNDPRIKKQREQEEAEKLAIKLAKKKNAQAKHRQAEERLKEAQRLHKEKEEAEAKRIKDEETAKREAGKLYRSTCKEFITFCVSKMPTGNYDKFFLEEYIKKFPTQQELDAVFETVRSFSDKQFDVQFKDMISEQAKKKREAVKGKELKVQEEKKRQETDLTDKKWSQEDLVNLTEAIKKFPPGTTDRWRVIGDELGKTQKETIAKAKEIQARKQRDVEAKRQQEQEKKEKLDQIKKQSEAKVAAQVKQQKAAATTKQNGASAAAPNPDAWTAEQQKQMESGMRTFAASLSTKERWISIAETVDGKSAKECYGRFKELCAKAKK